MADSIVPFSQSLAQSLVDSDEQFPVDFELAWQWLGYNSKQACKKKLTRNFDAGTDYLSKWMSVAHSNGLTASRTEQIMLTIECFKSLGMMAGTEQGKEIRKYFLNCEQVVKESLSLESNRKIELELEIEKTKLETAKIELEKERIVSINDRIIEELRLEQNQIEYALYSAGKLTPGQVREKLLDDMAAYIDRFVQVKEVMPKVRDLHQKFQSRKIPDERGNLVKINSVILRSLLPEVLKRCKCNQENIPSEVTKLRVKVFRPH
jgi:phage anti-repressor protein